jgi:nucleoside 2-deoxyribosyltransferase
VSFLIYLAGPIDDISRDQANDWRQNVAEWTVDVLLFNPVDAWLGAGVDTAERVDRMNRQVIASCDGVLANLSGPGRGFGTIREIEYARSLHIPVAVIGKLASLCTHDLVVAESPVSAFNELLDAIREQHPDPEDKIGTEGFSVTKRWRS